MTTARGRWTLAAGVVAIFLLGQAGFGGGSSNPCANYSAAVCQRLADADADGNIGDDWQRAINDLFWPGGVATTATDVYLAAPACGVHTIESQVVACADTSPPTGETISDCTGTTGTTPTLHFIGPWGCSSFYSYPIVNTVASAASGVLTFGNAHDSAGGTSGADGFPAAGAALGSGELRVLMQEPITVQIGANDYSGNPGLTSPAPFHINGVRGRLRLRGTDTGETGYNFGTTILNAAEDLDAEIELRTSDAQADAGQTHGLWLGPGAFNGVRLKYVGYRAGVYVGATTGSSRGGRIQIEPYITAFRGDATSAMEWQRWDYPTIGPGKITVFPTRRGSLASISMPAIDFSVQASLGLERGAVLRDLEVNCLADPSTSQQGCIRLTGCGTSIQPQYRIENVRINAQNIDGAGAGMIEVEDSAGGACTGIDLAPVVRLSNVTSFDTEGGTLRLFPDDTSASANRKGFFFAAPDMGGEWRSATITQATDLTAERCLNLEAQDPTAGDELLPCTDPRTLLYANEEAHYLALGVRVSNAGGALTAGDGCAIYPRINGTSESGTNGIGHTLVTGQTGLESAGDNDWVYVNRPITAGQSFQVAIADSLGADNVAGGTGANADEQCQSHVGTRVRFHFVRTPAPALGAAPYGAGN